MKVKYKFAYILETKYAKHCEILYLQEELKTAIVPVEVYFTGY